MSNPKARYNLKLAVALFGGISIDATKSIVCLKFSHFNDRGFFIMNILCDVFDGSVENNRFILNWMVDCDT